MAQNLRDALHFEKLDEDRVRCDLCPHNCILKQDAVGVCRARKNVGGSLYTMNFACVTSLALDPIEKKPLYHFHPGKLILSAGTYGCNFKCSFCQNWTIAQRDAQYTEITPGQLADLALEYADRGNIGVAYTYNEPSIWYEFVYDTSRLVREKGLVNVLVTNGFINRKPLEELLPYIDAMNIDVKAFTEKFYGQFCKGGLDAVKKTVELSASRCHVEITTLMIPGLNDSPEEIEELARWLSTVSPDIVLHLSRFFPNYLMSDVPPTPLPTLKKARDSALLHLRHVYLGNV